MDDINTIHALAYFNLLKTGSWIEEKLKVALKPFNLTHAQLNVLYILYTSDPEPVSANEMKKKILVSNPDVTRLLDRLVKKGYVLRRTCPENRRKIDISMTDSGRNLFMQAHLSAKLALGDFFKNKITENEANELRKILHKMRE
ncbi:MAG: MarR family transcriptional regulator [Bacteroidota bacterium]